MSSIGSVVAGSFYDPATGTVVQLNRIHQDSDFTMMGADEEDAAGSGIFLGEEASLELVFYDDDAAAIQQLVDWQDAETPLRFCLAGQRTNIIWDQDAIITVRKTKTMSPLQRQITTVTMTAKGKRLKIWQGVNLAHGFVIVQGFETGWQDSDDNNVPDGFVLSAGSTYTSIDFTNDVFTVQKSDADFASFTLSFGNIGRVFPISGIRLTIATDVLKLYSSENHRLGFLARDFGENSLGTIVGPSIETTGRHSLSVVTAEGTYFLRIYFIDVFTGSADDTLQIQFPSLRADENPAYIAG